MEFKLVSHFKPTGDQPQAIKELKKGVDSGVEAQVLLGATGSGKTFTIANLIAETQRPTLVLCHNKTLAAQLYGEFKSFFPENAVEYFISYYDYYQPEAYLPSTGLYIEKDLQINEEIEKLRLQATSSLLSGRRDVIIVASVSCIYGIGNPDEFAKSTIVIKKGDVVNRNKFLLQFVEMLYSRNDYEFLRGTFRVKGDTIDVFPAYADFAYRFIFFDDEIENIQRIDPITFSKISDEINITLYPAKLFVTGKETLNNAIKEIQDELVLQIQYFENEARPLEAKRIQERTEHDLEMMRELGYCSGIENYSRFFDQRKPGSRPFCLLDYFPDDFLMVIDESHTTLPQIRAMWGCDRSRKTNLVDYGFRLPAALDNRPLTFNEFENMLHQAIYVSATPGDYELQKTGGVIVEQVIRPTGLLDPVIEVRPAQSQVDDLLNEIDYNVKKGGRILVTTLTKRMAEELTKFLEKINVKTKYIHSEVKTMERIEILEELRNGVINVLVGVNLLREGLDLPEVTLVAILDADKEGFLRDQRSLIQTIGRAARNSEGKVILYGDKITGSMQRAIDETNRRRSKQIAHNEKYNITPTTIVKNSDNVFSNKYKQNDAHSIAAEGKLSYLNKEDLEKRIKTTKKEMEKMAKELNFIEAAKLRDIMFELQTNLDEK